MSDNTTVHLTIDGHSIEVPKGTTVYAALSQLGIQVPIFCYQDRMPPFGACRVCLVEVEKMGKLQTSCTLEAAEGMVVHTQSQNAVDGRKSILEFLLINHPLDCPICDRGGECPLQDNAIKYGPGLSRFFEEKRHFKKNFPLGPVLTLDRERCIVCARCTRFGDLIAGDHALEFIDRGYKTEVGTPGGKPAESKYIGNTIMICPVGALTSQVYRFRARPWDNTSTESTCPLCPVGCSLVLDSRDGQIMRTRSLENKSVNDIWLCDKGWFGYEFTSNAERLRKPLIRKNGTLQEATLEEAINLITTKIRTSKQIAGFGGNSLTFEENYIFQKFMREGLHTSHLDHRIGMPLFSLSEEGLPPGMQMEIGDCEKLDHAYLWGLDLTEEFPIIWLRLKQAINHGAKVTFVGHYAPEIAKHLHTTLLHSPGQEIELIQKLLPDAKGVHFIGRQYLSSPQRSQILEAFNSLPINILEGSENSLGARLSGMHPELGPFGEILSQPGMDYLQTLQTAADKNWDFIYVAGADPAKKTPTALWEKARANLDFLVVHDLFLTKTAQQADVVLPVLSFAEKTGTFINVEGRAQKFRPGKEIPEDIYSDTELFTLIAQKLNIPLTLDFDPFHLLKQGSRVQLKRNLTPSKNTAISSSKLWATFSPSLFDQGNRMKHNTHLFQLTDTPFLRMHPKDGILHNIKDGATVNLSSTEGSLNALIKWDEKVAVGAIVVPLGFDSIPAHHLSSKLWNTPVKVKPC